MAKQTPAEEKKAHQAWLNEKVPFTAFKDGDKYKDDLNITVNGKTWQIQRGKPVMIPRSVLFAIQDAERQGNVAAATSNGLSEKYQKLVDGKIL